jgi:hypothetical protein
MLNRDTHPSIVCDGMRVFAVAGPGRKMQVCDLSSGHSRFGVPTGAQWVDDERIHITTDKGRILEYNKYRNGPKIVC